MAKSTDKNVSFSSSSSSSNNNSNRSSQSFLSNSDQISATCTAGVVTGATPPLAWTHIVRGGGFGVDSEPSGLVTAAVLTEQEGVVAASASDSLPVTAAVGNGGGRSRGGNGASSSSSSMEEYAVPECSENVNGDVSKKPVWKKQSNADAESSSSAIGADWPSLPNSFQSSKKGLSSGSTKPLSDGASPFSSLSAASAAQSTEIPNSTYKNYSSSQNNPVLSRPRSFKNRHGSNGPSNGGLIQSPTVPNPVIESGPSSHISNTHKNSNWESGHKAGPSSHSHGNSSRRSNGGHYPRGNGHQNYGGRQDQDRGNRDWNLHRMDGHIQPPHVPRAFIRPAVPPPPPPMPSIAPPYIGPPFMQPYLGNPMGFHHPEVALYYMPVPPPHQPVFFAPLTELQQRILKQINYYFSPANLVKDQHLRRQMDHEGWVHISVIAGFKKIVEMTDDIELILSSIRYSSEVEVLGDKVRKRFEWDKYVLYTVQDPLAEVMQKVNLEANNYSYGSTNAQPNVHTEAFPSNSLSGDSINRFQPSDRPKQ